MSEDQPNLPSTPHDVPATGAQGEAGAPATGVERVDAALTALDDLDEAPVSEHAAVYDEVHRRLADALNTLDGE